MKVLLGLDHLQTAFQGSVVTVGNFDGVHLGHQTLLREVVQTATELKVPSVVLTFDPHPVKVLYPERNLHKLFTDLDLRTQIEKMGVDFLLNQPFSRDFSRLPAAHFLAQLQRKLSPKAVIVGHDFAFGMNREGSFSELHAWGVENHVRVHRVAEVKINGLTVSSSEIRKALDQGEVERASELLGRSFYVSGLVVKGFQRGKSLGFATANVAVEGETTPASGVYVCKVEALNKAYFGVTNIGINPTFADDSDLRKPRVESHIFDFSEDLYGQKLTVHFLARLRNEQKFATPQALAEQIQKDVTEAMRWLDLHKDKKGL